MDTDIAIIGMAGRFPGAKNLDEFWQVLKEGRETISFFSDEELLEAGIHESLINNPNYVKASPIIEGVGHFDEGFFGYSVRDAKTIDPQHRIFLEGVWHALEHAGYEPDNLDIPVCLFAGSALNSYLLFTELYPRLNGEYISTMINSGKDFLATRASFKLNLKGPSVTVQTACSTSLVAVHMACQNLLNGESDMAIAGGVSVRVPHVSGHMYSSGSMLSPDGHCRPFDAKAMGTMFGSGMGVVILKRLEEALEDRDTIHAVIKGTAINNDGASKSAYTAPSVSGQASVYTEALAVADIDPTTISYVEAHGTGTYLGDPIEVLALTRAFEGFTDKKGYCRLGSVKSNVGHLDAAAGMAGLIKTVLSMQHGELPASINFDTPNPKIDFKNSPFVVNTSLTPWTSDDGPLRAGVTALGIGGTNAHLILEEAPPADVPQRADRQQVIMFSARTPEALDTTRQQLGAYFKDLPESRFQDAAYTLQAGRKTFSHKGFIVARNPEEASALLLEHTDDIGGTHTELYRQSVVMMFSGQGAQYVNMAREVYKQEPVFKQWIDEQAEFLKPVLSLDLRNILFPADPQEEEPLTILNQTCNTQPALFMVEYAMAQLWMSWGIQPSALIGHSIGEYVAACLGGVFSWQDALKVVAERGRLMQSMPSGKMLSIMASEKQVQPYLKGAISLAAVNGPGLCVVSGPEPDIVQLAEELASKDVHCRVLHTSHAFHSSMMDPILEAFTDFVASVYPKAPTTPVVSNVTGTWLTADQATDATYWASQLRNAVLFEKGIGLLLNEKQRVFLEVGPGNTLAKFVKSHADFSDEYAVLSSIRHPKEKVSDHKRLLKTVGQLWLNGIEVHWANIHGEEQPYRIPAPAYPFAKNTHWFKPRQENQQIVFGQFGYSGNETKPAAQPKPRNERQSNWYYLPSWTRNRLISAIPDTSDICKLLVFSNGSQLDKEFIDWARSHGHQVATVLQAEEFATIPDLHFEINPENPDDYAKLLNELNAEDAFPQYIVHFWTYSDAVNKQDLETIKQNAFYSQFHLAKTLWQQNGQQPVKTAVITNNLFMVTGEESVVPEKALLLGPSLVVPNEYRSYQSFVVDTSDVKPEAFGNALMHAFTTNSTAPITAYRGKHEWIERIEPYRGEELAGVTISTRLKDRGTYLITGGMGGIGLAIAQKIAADVHHPNIVLVGRSTMPKRGSWDEWIQNHASDDNVSTKIRAIRDLEAQGAQVLPVSANVSDPESVQDMITEVTSTFGSLNGVIHAAGMVSNNILLTKEIETVEAVFEAKVTGTLNLGEALKEVQPDFFLLCSSINGYIAPPGLIDYVAANRFLDQYAIAYSEETGIKTQTVNWPGWTEVGMFAEQIAAHKGELTAWLKKGLQQGLNNEDGTLSFIQVLESGYPNLIVSPVQFPYSTNPATDVTTKDTASTNGHINGAHAPHQNGHNPTPESMENTLQEIWARVLGVDYVGVRDNFFELGGDSMLAITLLAEMEKKVGAKNLSLASVLESPTIEEVAMLIEE